MKYAIFILTAITLMWCYHQIKYFNKKFKYKSFEHYLILKTDDVLRGVFIIYTTLFKMFIFIGVCYVGYVFFEYLMNIFNK